MQKTIIVNGQEYELQIMARKVINEGRTAVSMDAGETEALLSSIEESLRLATDAIDYAVEQRKYESDFERDEETAADIFGAAERWKSVNANLLALLDR